MKPIQIASFFFVLLFTFDLFGGIPPAVRRIEYSPANPVAGQPVSFTFTPEINCQFEGVVPDAENNISNILLFPNMYTYPSAGTYYVALDIVDNPACIAARQPNQGNGSNRELQGNFEMGPVGGPYSMAVIDVVDGVFTSPIVIRAPAPIPTMSQWGIITLLLLVSIIGVVYLINFERKKASSVI